METPDILNSKIKKLRIELPHYRFSHSSSGDSSHHFIGRERTKERLKKIIEDSPDEPGVYLIAGNRGVGKTSLVSEVIKETSLETNSTFFKKLKYLFTSKRNRLYLRINFGHKLKDEKDILRLIARTLSTEYQKYRNSFWRMLPWRVIAFGFLLLFAYLFSGIVKEREFYKQCIKGSELYKASSQVRLDNEDPSHCNFSQDSSFYKVKSFLLAFDDVAFEISKRVVNIPKYFFEDKEININNTKMGNFIFPINYLFWLSFFSMYLFCVLLFRCNWITHFFVTHRIIMRRLKKLNIDITHSTERENWVGINNEKTGPLIGIRARKSRNTADAREIEKELQDILDDMQRIPILMCRPKIVIVFDELDKVESGDAKASMFSINATREKQTEILRILSNMKYFLSTAKAKFIFIAGREMYDIHLADVSERNNYIGSIFNAVIYVPSFLTDHPTGKKLLPQESGIASLPEEFVCRRLIPSNYKVKYYDLKHYRKYLREKIFHKDTDGFREEKIEKIIAVLQQFIIYLAHVSKGAPKKMMQLFESFIEIHLEKDKNKNTLFVQRYNKSRHFLSFNYYKQYTVGIVAYLITPIFYRLSESNIKEHSDKLLVSALRFVDFVFKFHKHSFSYKHLDISPEMQEVNRAPELKSVAVDLLNYLAQVHINKSSFSLSEYKFDGLIANEIFAMAKTDEVFSALFSFSLDELSPLKNHYKDLLEKTEKEYKDEKDSAKYIDAVSSLQAILGDLYYYDDGLEEAEVYYKRAVQQLHEIKNNGMTIEQLYVYIRNMLRLGIIYQKREQYDFAYLTYGELCKQIQRSLENIQSCIYRMSFEKTAYEGLKMLYLPFIAKLQILELSHIGGITCNHLTQLDEEFKSLTNIIGHEEANLLEAEFYSRVADILYYKNLDLKCKKNKNRENDQDELCDNMKNLPENTSCTACYYYHKALCTLLNIKDRRAKVEELLYASVEKIKDNCDMKFYTTLARILSDWGNVFFSCDNSEENKCYIYDRKDCNSENSSDNFIDKCIKYLKPENEEPHSLEIGELGTKKDITFAMYAISSEAYRKASLYKRSSYQIYKMLCLFKYYKICNCKKIEDYIEPLSKTAIHYLWYANDDLNVLELNKRKKDFNKETIKYEDKIPLRNLLVDSEITRIRILVKELGLKSNITPEKLNEYYGIRITSPYRINYSIVGRVYRLRLKSIVNYEAYQKLLENLEMKGDIRSGIEFILEKENCNNIIKDIFGEYFSIEKIENVSIEKKIDILENLIADSIYCLMDIAQLTETMDETYLFPHSFLGSIHEHLSFWIRLYETYEIYLEKNPEINKHSQIKKLLKQYLDAEWRELLSGYRENQRALSHYYKCLEMHTGGRAYHYMIDIMCYVRDDYNDRSDHFNIAEERHLIVNGEIRKKIYEIKNLYKDSELYDVDNYFEKI